MPLGYWEDDDMDDDDEFWNDLMDDIERELREERAMELAALHNTYSQPIDWGDLEVDATEIVIGDPEGEDYEYDAADWGAADPYTVVARDLYDDSKLSPQARQDKQPVPCDSPPHWACAHSNFACPYFCVGKESGRCRKLVPKKKTVSAARNIIRDDE